MYYYYHYKSVEFSTFVREIHKKIQVLQEYIENVHKNVNKTFRFSHLLWFILSCTLNKNAKVY